MQHVVNKEGLQLGVIAQEIEDILPEIVLLKHMKKLVSTQLILIIMTWYLVNAVKELSAEVEKLKNGS